MEEADKARNLDVEGKRKFFTQPGLVVGDRGLKPDDRCAALQPRPLYDPMIKMGWAQG